MSTLTADQLSWTSGRRSILSDVSLTADTGKVLGVIGPNGAGKTSLLRILAGLRTPDRGRVTLDGAPMRSLSRRSLARRLAIVEQSLEVHEDVSVEASVALGRTPYRGTFDVLGSADRAAIADALEATGLTSHRTRSWRTLSGGEQQRAQLARALAQQPAVIILDEPTNHLDIRYQLDTLELLRDSGLTVVSALHDLNLAARFCDRLVVLCAGEVRAAGTPEEVLTEALIDEIYGVQAVVQRSPHTDSPTATYLRVTREAHPVSSASLTP